MPARRFLAPWHGEMEEGGLEDLVGRSAIYHCVSRVVDRRFVFGFREKEKFVALMRRYEGFSQVQVLAFCVMSNHFHLLVKVPVPPPERGRDWSDEEFLEHLSRLYGPRALAEIRWQLELFRGQKAHAAAEEFRGKFFARMWDLSEFMKGLKQSFSRWFNKAHERRGTLWEERFKSVLAEDGEAARVMAAYIDLNPVRAGMVTDPKDYRWSSYGEAVAGKERAREGIERLMCGGREGLDGRGDGAEQMPSWRVVVKRYRDVLHAPLQKEQVHSGEGDGSTGETGVPGGPVRQFSDGMAVGLPAFLELIFRLARDRFGPRRRDGARRMRGIRTELCAMRDLQLTTGGA